MVKKTMSRARIAVNALGIVTTLGMFFVLIMGSAVTNTGSEQGCGRSWPLCHGQLIPQFAVATAIEFSHRAVVGVETVLILALAASALILHGSRLEIRILTALMVAFLFLQAGLGAWAVMYPQVAAILALHFGVSLISFASVLLTTLFLIQIDGADLLRDRAIPGALRWSTWAVAAYSYVVVYLGAYIRHSHADFACTGWPLCNGDAVPTLVAGVAAAFAHRIAALVLTLAVLGLMLWTHRLRSFRPDLWRASLAAFGAIVLQSVSGAVVVWTHLDLFSALSHAALAGVLFGSLMYLCVHALPRAEAVKQGMRANAGRYSPSSTVTPRG